MREIEEQGEKRSKEVLIRIPWGEELNYATKRRRELNFLFQFFALLESILVLVEQMWEHGYVIMTPKVKEKLLVYLQLALLFSTTVTNPIFSTFFRPIYQNVHPGLER